MSESWFLLHGSPLSRKKFTNKKTNTVNEKPQVALESIDKFPFLCVFSFSFLEAASKTSPELRTTSATGGWGRPLAYFFLVSYFTFATATLRNGILDRAADIAEILTLRLAVFPRLFNLLSTICRIGHVTEVKECECNTSNANIYFRRSKAFRLFFPGSHSQAYLIDLDMTRFIKPRSYLNW